MSRAVVVLAAGKGTRMKSPRAKVLHPVLGRPMLARLLDELRALEADRTLVVVGHEREAVSAVAKEAGAETLLQEPQLGTGHALLICREALAAAGECEVLLVAGDVPLLPVAELGRYWEEFHASGAPAGVVTLELADPTGYGRVVRGPKGRVRRIVEHKDATPEQLHITEVNSGVYFFRSPQVFELLARVDRANAQGEYYLPDVLALAFTEKAPVLSWRAEEPERWLGVNSQVELARANEQLRAEVVRRLMDSGVTVLMPETVWVEPEASVGPGSLLHPYTRICGAAILGECVEVRPFSTVSASRLGAGTLVKEQSHLDGTETGAGCILGPFCRTREGTVLSDGVHLGNFVETKKAKLGKGVKANHLSYLGDATVGAGSNIGAGTITCNYDGVNKHPTVLGEKVFIGSDTQLVAPVTVGDGAYVGAGTTLTKDVPGGALAISRVPQKNIEGWVERKAPQKK